MGGEPTFAYTKMSGEVAPEAAISLRPVSISPRRAGGLTGCGSSGFVVKSVR